MTAYELIFPDYLDGYEHETEAKGYLVGVSVVVDGQPADFVVYDPVRLMQEVADAIESAGLFSEQRLLVVARVTREEITSAIQKLSAGNFHDFL
ncbi:hypothetical protein AB0368_28690 [Actinoplanes sp. NPDC051475]|uniref:hypothetical protein n=1 Tax=Actinoplanes sp. NPDC051475 TaxID=3157225 RepID=UPI00344DB742